MHLVVGFLSIVVLSGCASTPQYTSIGGSNAHNARQSNPGISGRNTGAVLGGAAGAAAASVANTKPAVTVFATVAGAVVGAFLGDKYDQEKAAIGTTDCGYSARKNGTDGNGTYNQTARSQKSVPGYKADCN